MQHDIVILCRYESDPRQIRVVVRNGVSCPLEICNRDHLGGESWHAHKYPPFLVRGDALIARALFESWKGGGLPDETPGKNILALSRPSCNIARSADRTIIDLGTLRNR